MNDPFLPAEVRAFVACEIPAQWTEALAETSRALSKAGLSHLRWVRPDGIHITLKFLGDVGRHLLPDILAAMEAAAALSLPLELTLRGLGTFTSRGQPRVLWAGIEGEREALARLQQELDAELTELGFARELRPFSPHLTLARVPDDAPASTGAVLAAALRQQELRGTDALRVRELVLMRSQLGRGGAVYSRLAGAPLSDPAGLV
jgi:RNA 2',3'-cyclic 3'-phosphodiesterase